MDSDGDVDGIDFLWFMNVCYNGSLNPPNPECGWKVVQADMDCDGDADGTDFLTFANCFNGSSNPPRCTK
jgi:hypothetical protein